MTDPSSGQAADAMTIARLTALSRFEYDRVRVTEAEGLKIRVTSLDAEVERARGAGGADDPLADRRPPEFSDESLALRFSTQHQHRLRYVADWGRWLIYDGKVWTADATMLVFDYARAICRTASAECNDPSLAGVIASARTVAAVERLAKADRRHAATTDQWDVDHWLLNTPGGVVDLRTSITRAHQPADHMTRITAVAPGGECPAWQRFLARITGEDGTLQDFLMRAAGYCLTGSTREHALFFGFGTGANGKGTFLNTLAAILGGYAAVAPMETFTASYSDRHPTELAALRGARLVTAQETEEGRHWAESRLKSLTGGDPVSARFMRQDFFTFMPQFKLFAVGNHKPGLRGVDEAIRRRLHLIPFAVSIPAAERDPELSEKLKAEWPGILTWAIEGCRHWQKMRLAPPAVVTEATDEYLDAEDALATWIADQTKRIGYGGTETGILFADWRKWAVAVAEDPGSQKRFSQALEAKGFKRSRTTGVGRSQFLGIALADVQPPASEPAHERY
jgi:putative DNA primase/helicase